MPVRLTISVLRVFALAAAAILALPVHLLYGQDRAQPGKYWQDTPDETLWQIRYASCEYGFAVALPPGVIAHSAKPNPNHGFVLSLYDPGRTDPVPLDSDRLLSVKAERNDSGRNSLKEIVNYQIDLVKQDQRKFAVLERHSTMLAGVPAVGFAVQYKTPEGNAIEQRIVAVRSNIVYEIALRTNEGDQPADEPLFQKIRSGLTFLPLDEGQCTDK